ncbi:hypothetical protein Hanom_Chr03g00214651 [Helianthus anomalus]
MLYNDLSHILITFASNNLIEYYVKILHKIRRYGGENLVGPPRTKIVGGGGGCLEIKM